MDVQNAKKCDFTIILKAAPLKRIINSRNIQTYPSAREYLADRTAGIFCWYGEKSFEDKETES